MLSHNLQWHGRPSTRRHICSPHFQEKTRDHRFKTTGLATKRFPSQPMLTRPYFLKQNHTKAKRHQENTHRDAHPTLSEQNGTGLEDWAMRHPCGPVLNLNQRKACTALEPAWDKCSWQNFKSSKSPIMNNFILYTPLLNCQPRKVYRIEYSCKHEFV